MRRTKSSTTRKRSCTVAETTKSPTRRRGLVGLLSSIDSANNPLGGAKPACFHSQTNVEVPSLRPSFNLSWAFAMSVFFASTDTRNLGTITFSPPSISSDIGRQREQCRAGPGVHLPACQALIARLFALNVMKTFPQPLASFVQLRLRITYRASNYLGYLVVLVPLHTAQHQNCPLPRR